MRRGPYLVMRYGPLIGHASDSRRRVSVVTRERTANDALYYAQGWMAVERQHGDRAVSVWVAKQGAPATRRPQRLARRA